jgi:hypothetical protein
MDKDPKVGRIKNKNVITASEIAQYTYCPNAWYLKRCGSTPESKGFAYGIMKHENMGREISSVNRNENASRNLAIIGCLIFLIAFLILAWWMM